MVLSYLTLSDRIIGPIWSNWLHWIKDNFIFIPSVNRHSVESWDLADSASHTGNYDWLQQILWPLIGLPVIPGETDGLRRTVLTGDVHLSHQVRLAESTKSHQSQLSTDWLEKIRSHWNKMIRWFYNFSLIPSVNRFDTIHPANLQADPTIALLSS